MTVSIPLSSAGYPYYRRPSEAGPTPPSNFQDSGYICWSLKLSPLPERAKWLRETWESCSSGDEEPYYKQIADALDRRGLAWSLLSVGQFRLPPWKNSRWPARSPKLEPKDPGHPSVVVGVADDSSETHVAEVASEVELVLQRHSIVSTVGVAAMHCNPRPCLFHGSPEGLAREIPCEVVYSDHLDLGRHCGLSVACAGSTIVGTTGPLLRVTLPDGAAHFALLTSHHVVSGSREAIHANPGAHDVGRPVVSPSDPDHGKLVSYLKSRVDENKNDRMALIFQGMIDAGETISSFGRETLDKNQQDIKDLEAALAKAETFERHLGHILCSSGLRAAQHVDGHSYAQDWALVIIDPKRISDEEEMDNECGVTLGWLWYDKSNENPHWKVGRSTGLTIAGSCGTVVQTMEYDCDEGKVRMRGAARMVVSPVTADQFSAPWYDSGDSGAPVFGPRNPGRGGRDILGVVSGGDFGPEIVQWGLCDDTERLQHVVRSDNPSFFTPIEAIVAHVQERLEEDLGGKVTVELYEHLFAKWNREGKSPEEKFQLWKQRQQELGKMPGTTGTTGTTDGENGDDGQRL
ncbi:hypothetical protein CPLU01_04166 [Colletotrichum plurivorum]|uniref:Uncharacterized protein n=1 Tax=Colletotrichum plurivorum TaxID=2175906 RepID=A0A8H6NKC9_9PEZI|nr:hypothetical protein CPLU01_04166 [Colletotrichum plurivorum]